MRSSLSAAIEVFNRIHPCTINLPTYDIFKNDLNYDFTLKRLFGNRYPRRGRGVGIMVGVGAVYSVLPELSCDSVLICDYNSFVLETASYVKNLIMNSDTLQVFDRRNLVNRYYVEVIRKYGQDSFEEFKHISRRTLGEFSYEFSDRRFSVCKDALSTTDTYTVQLDLNDSNSIKSLIEVFANLHLEISFVDFSNVGDYIFDKDLFANDLTRLPYSENCCFVFSTSVNNGQLPKSIGTVGSIDGYTDYLRGAK